MVLGYTLFYLYLSLKIGEDVLNDVFPLVVAFGVTDTDCFRPDCR